MFFPTTIFINFSSTSACPPAAVLQRTDLSVLANCHFVSCSLAVFVESCRSVTILEERGNAAGCSERVGGLESRIELIGDACCMQGGKNVCSAGSNPAACKSALIHLAPCAYDGSGNLICVSFVKFEWGRSAFYPWLAVAGDIECAVAFIPYYTECVENSPASVGGDLRMFEQLEIECTENLPMNGTATLVRNAAKRNLFGLLSIDRHILTIHLQLCR